MNTPTPTTLARNLRQLADRLDDEGDRAIRRAVILAARGWPTSTNGAEGGRSSDPTSSTERAALNPGPFDGIDYRMRTQMSNLSVSVLLLQVTFNTVMAHASDDDYIKPGTGVCDRCGLVCTNKTRALKLEGTGLCHACDEALRRYRRKYPNTTRSDFLTDTAGAVAYENVRRRIERDTA